MICRSSYFENLKLKCRKEKIAYVHKPGIDNLGKYLFHLLQGGVYHDDEVLCQFPMLY